MAQRTQWQEHAVRMLETSKVEEEHPEVYHALLDIASAVSNRAAYGSQLRSSQAVATIIYFMDRVRELEDRLQALEDLVDGMRRPGR